MPNNKYKVEMPRNPTDIIAMLGKVSAKHTDLGADSPLGGLKWAAMSPNLSEADAQDQLSDEFHRKAEKATGERDKYMPGLVEFLRSARDVLLGIHRDNPDALGDYGLKVSDATSAAPAAVPK